MTAVPPPASSVTPAALSAFVRGVERRGFVLALLQQGGEAGAERSLAAALAAFRQQAPQTLMADWPIRFWRLLAATPGFRADAAASTWPTDFAALADCAPADRLALLLRIVAGLDEPMAADVLGIGEDGYRQALARACPRDPAGHPDAQAWRALAEAAQREVRTLAPERLVPLVAAAVPASAAAMERRGERAAVAARPTPSAPPRPRRPQRRLHPALIAAPLVLAALAAAAWWWAQRPPALPPAPVVEVEPGALHVVDAAPTLVEQLPEDGATAPPAPAGPDPDDQAMLADPDLETAGDADFFAWYGAGAPLPVDESDPRPVAAEAGGSGLETVDDEN